MEWRGGRRGRSNQTALPLRTTTTPTSLSYTVSCWYCDFKFLAFNEPLFRFGRRYSRYLRLWFSMGIGFSVAALVGVTVILLWDLVRALLAYTGNAQLGNSASIIFPLTSGMNISLPNVGNLCISSVMSIFVHELGHALAAARTNLTAIIVGTPFVGSSEGVHVEYVAVFLAVLFPGALVAFNHASIEALPKAAALRIYCAGIWHNAVFCAVCALALFLLPIIFSPFYLHGEGPMVLGVSPMSPFYGSLSPHDIIFSLDGGRIHTAQEWTEKISFLTKLNLKHLDGSGQVRGKSSIGYCVPHYFIEEGTNIQLIWNQTTCPKELTAFAPMMCLNATMPNDGSSDKSYENIAMPVQCFNAKDIIKLKRCGYGCLCSKAESCFSPVELPGLAWIDVTYSSPSFPECQSDARNIMRDTKNPNIRERRCLQSLVFIGDPMSMAHSVRLTSYQPRWSINWAADLPHWTEKLLTCAFHVSMILALLNSLPVFFLDGESILEGILYHVKFLSHRRKEPVLRCCLLAMTIVFLISVMRIFFIES